MTLHFLIIVSEIITWKAVFIFSGVIHGDYNEQNLLVTKNHAKPDESPYEEHDIVGVIDFGDMAETCYVYEVMSYALFTFNCKGAFILERTRFFSLIFCRSHIAVV